MNQISAEVWQAAYRLEQTWQDAATRWQDVTSAEFEAQHWQPLAATTAAYLDAARTLEDALAHIRSLAAEEWT